MTEPQQHGESHGTGKDRSGDSVLRVERRMKLGKPHIVTVCQEDGVATDWTSHRTGEEMPNLPAAEGSFDRIIAHDILEHVLDEEAWINALARLLAPGGAISFRVPLEGPLAWMDARNIYRYVADLSGRGLAPSETLPTGWHRHYHAHDLDRLMRRAGLSITEVRREGLPGLDIPHVAALVAGDLLLRRPAVESRLIDLRDRIDPWALRGHAGPLSTHLRIEATKVSIPSRPDQDGS